MDEIQDCIADAQFGEVLRGRENCRPTGRIPAPPPGFNAREYASENSIDLAYCITQPVGLYILNRDFPAAESCYNFLAELHAFKKIESPGYRTYKMLLDCAKKMPAMYHPAVEDVAVKLNNTVLPSLRSMASMSCLIEQNGSSEPGEDSQIDNIAGVEAVSEDNIEVEEVDSTEQDEEDEVNKRRLSMSRHRTENKRMALDMFENIRDQILEDQTSNWEMFEASPSYERLMQLFWYIREPVTLDSFNIFRDLGRGAFGVVSGAKLKTTGALFAIKCMNKKLLKGKKALRLVKAERQVLAKLGEMPSKFTVFLQYSFHDKETFFLALPLCSGGDLQYHLAVERYFSPERARFHIAEVVLGIAHLHSLGIIYRDLKPDNILLDEEGHCRISDMGLAVITNGKSLRGRAGTPGYWPPEMILKKRYSFPVDWWSTGCVLYEMLSGRCPFSKLNTKMERDDATLKWKVKFPEKLGNGTGGESRPFPEDAKRIILRLLNRDRQNRLGGSENGSEDVKEDPYFESIDWAKLNRGEVEPPWKPRKEAIHAFNQSDIDGKSNEHDYRKLKLTAEDEIPHFDFTSNIKHQEDIVQVLKLQDKGELGYLEQREGPNCCLIS
mmetsp:Transcript_18000/g.29198  ORF Transcript_18000/g.29198 Transcript_18000/m.29198 type:complete len:610 (-) Transcript_18000:11-1840(-)